MKWSWALKSLIKRERITSEKLTQYWEDIHIWSDEIHKYWNTNMKHKDKYKCSWHKSESKGAHPHEAIKVVAQPALEISLWNHHGTVAGPLAPIVKCICLYFKIIWAKVQSVFDQSCICPNFQINLLKKIIAKPRHPCRCTGQSGTGIIIGGLGKVRRALLIYSDIFLYILSYIFLLVHF